MQSNDPVSRVPFADAVFDSLQDEGLFVLGPTGIILFCNAGAATLCGVAADELCGTHVARLYPAEEAELGLPARDLRTAARGGRLLRDGWLVRGDGARFWGETTITAFRAGDGALLGYSRVTRDLTERAAMEAALRRSEAKFSGIVSLASDAIICINDEQRITLFNRGAERMFGYDAARLLGEPLDVLLPERVRAVHRRHVHGFARSENDARRMGERAEIFGVRRGGEEFPAEAAISHQEVEGERIMTVVLRDVTERKRVELEIASLLHAEQTLRAEAQAARREAERAAERIQRLQTVTAALSGARTPGEVARAMLGDAARMVGSHAGVLAVVSADGAGLELLAPTGYPGDVVEAWTHVPLVADIPLAEAVRTRKPVLVSSSEALAGRYPSITETRGRTGTEALAAVPMVAEGTVLGAVGFSFPEPREFDGADREFLDALAGQCAQALTRARLYESEVAAHEAAEAALQARDEVIRVVAHDMGNSLSAILITTAVLLRRLGEAGEGDATVEAIRNIRLTATQMKRLRDDLLDLATIEAGRLSVLCSPYGPRRMLDEAVAQLAPLAHEKGIRLRVEAGEELPDVFADRDRVAQVLGNLGGNGIKFTPPGGELRFHAREDRDGTVRFLVSDTGPGIPEGDRDHVFDRFWKSEKGNRHGAGLGLAIARGIVEAHGGRMWLESTGQEGTTFAFTLPREAPSGSGGGLDQSRPEGEVDEILAAPQP